MATDDHTRRRILELLGATAAATGVAGVATAQDDGDDDDNDDNGDDDSDDGNGDDGDDQLPIVLGARREYWLGVAPEEIEGEQNPTLELEADEEYEIVWINLDGVDHDLAFEDEDGETLDATETEGSAGETVSTTVQLSEDAAEYFCEFHPDSMRGDVDLDGGFDLSRDDDGDNGDGDDDGNGDDGDDNGDNGNGDDDHDGHDHDGDDSGY